MLLRNAETYCKIMNNQTFWHGKPYYSLNAYCKNTYGEKLSKIALNAGFTCPNRDGTLPESVTCAVP